MADYAGIATGEEIDRLAGVQPGIVSANRALVSSNLKDLEGLRNLKIDGNLNVNSATGQIQINGTNIFPVGTANIVDGSITTLKIASAAVDSTKLATDSVTDVKIQGPINAAKISNGTLPASAVGSGNITPDKIATGAVLTAAIADSNVTFQKIQNVAAFSVVARPSSTAGVASNLTAAANTVLAKLGTADVAFSQVTDALIASGINGSKISNATVGLEKVSNISQATLLGRASGAGSGPPVALNSSQILGIVAPGGTLGVSEVSAETGGGLATTQGGVDGPITTTGTIRIADLGIATGKIANGAVTGVKIANNTILLDKLAQQASDTILGVVAGTANVAAIQATNGDTVLRRLTNAGTLGFGKITSALIDAGAIVTAAIANSNVTTEKIANSAVTTDKINNAAVTYAKIQNIAANSVIGNRGSGAAAPSEISIDAGPGAVGNTVCIRTSTGGGNFTGSLEVGRATSNTATITLSNSTGNTARVVQLTSGGDLQIGNADTPVTINATGGISSVGLNAGSGNITTTGNVTAGAIAHVINTSPIIRLTNSAGNNRRDITFNTSTSNLSVNNTDSTTLLNLTATGNLSVLGSISSTGAIESMRFQTQKTAVENTNTAVEFNDIPSWVKKITLSWTGVWGNGVAVSDINYFMFTQFGTSSQWIESGYSSDYDYWTTYRGFGMPLTQVTSLQSGRAYGVVEFIRPFSEHMWISNRVSGWVENWALFAQGGYIMASSGNRISLSSPLTRLRFRLNANVTNSDVTWKSGSTFNIMYE